MPTYNIYPSVDENNNFPPAIRAALSKSEEFSASVDLLGWKRGPIRADTDINTWFGDDRKGVWTFSGSAATSIIGLPEGVVAGTLIVFPGLGGQLITSYSSRPDGERIYFRGEINLSGGMGEWQDISSKNSFRAPGLIPSGTNLNNLYLNERVGYYTVNSTTAAETLVNLPVVAPGKLINSPGGAAYQIYISYGLNGTPPGYWFRAVANISTHAWTPWQNLAANDDEQYALKHAVRLDAARKRYGYTIGTAGKAMIALQFDDAQKSFQDKVLPILREFDIPATVALAVRWVEGGVTSPYNYAMPWTTVQSWVVNDGISPQSHSYSHSKASTDAEVYNEIITSADHMETQMPMVCIDDWSMPGTGVDGDPYGGYNGRSVEDFTQTKAGKLLLSRYAFVFARTGGYLQPGGGQSYIGQSHGIAEASTLAEFKVGVESAISGPYALTMMHHPAYLDTEGYKTTAELRECIKWLAEQRDLGRLIIATRRALTGFNPDSNYRDNLYPGVFNNNLRGWSGWSIGSEGHPTSANTSLLTHTLEFLPVSWARGSSREFHAIVKASTDSVIEVTLTVTQAMSIVKRYNIPAGRWVDVRKFLTIPKVGYGTMKATIQRISGGTVSVQQVNLFAA